MSFRRCGPAAAIVIGIVWAAAGLVKATDAAGFHGALLAYGLPLPDPVLRLAAVWVPWFELALGICLLTGKWRGTAALAGAALASVFVILLAQAILRGLDPRCGCFGNGMPRWMEHPGIALARAGGLLLGCLWVWRRHPDS